MANDVTAYEIWIEAAPPPFVRVQDLDGVLHWIPAVAIRHMQAASGVTELLLDTGQTLKVREHGDDVLFSVKRTMVISLVKLLR
jgi:hypothetical protein